MGRHLLKYTHGVLQNPVTTALHIDGFILILIIVVFAVVVTIMIMVAPGVFSHTSETQIEILCADTEIQVLSAHGQRLEGEEGAFEQAHMMDQLRIQ